MATVSSARCTPSATSSTTISPRAAAARHAATGRGRGGARGGIALNRWVADSRSPVMARAARTAAVVAAAVASVWPRLGTTPCSASTASRSAKRAVSGARVIVATAPGAASSTSRSTAGSPGRRAAGSCAPHRAAARNGPSRCRPASRPSATSGASVATRRASTACGAETRLASWVVVPWARWWATAPRAPAVSASGKPWPAPPWQWTSTSPGSSSRSDGGGVPASVQSAVGPTQPMRSPVTATIPSSIRRPPVITVPRRIRSDMGFTPPDTGAQAALGDSVASVASVSFSSSRPGVRRFQRRMTNRNTT